jgi:uncharacterized membrane protein YcaP (DUF421 family)
VEIPDLGSDLVSVVARTAIVYVFLVVGLRLAGRREVGQLSIFDLVVILVISDAVQNSMVGENVSLLGGIAAASTLIVLDRLLSVVTSRSTRVRRALEGEPTMLVRDGTVMDAALRREGIDREELDAAIRGHGLATVADVALAVLETNGSISVIPRPGAGGPTGDSPPGGCQAAESV